MRRGSLVAAIVVVAVGGMLWAAQEKKKAGKTGGKEAVHVEAGKAQFKEVLPGVKKSVLWGDDQKGPYGSFTRFAPGHKNALHTHTSDIRIVVLEGAYLYGTDQGEVRVGPKSYFFIPGGTKHTSAGDAREGCLFYEESPGKFDINQSN